ncbi:hypothetical protein, partial [Azospirillum sp. B506]|uniref:hypothetical protein n=1 Tax=Azospirillum sp. B506 TaxID=137721 RepID=UPI001B3B949D
IENVAITFARTDASINRFIARLPSSACWESYPYRKNIKSGLTLIAFLAREVKGRNRRENGTCSIKFCQTGGHSRVDV